MNERGRNAADDWIRDHMPDPDECSLEDNEEEGYTQSYFSVRLRDSASVVYKVAGEDGKVTSVLQEVYHGEGSQEEPDEQRWLVKPQGEERQRGNRLLEEVDRFLTASGVSSRPMATMNVITRSLLQSILSAIGKVGSTESIFEELVAVWRE